MRAREPYAIARQARQFGGGVQDTIGPFAVKAYGVDVENGDRFAAIGNNEGSSEQRHIRADTALVCLRSPAALRCAGSGRDVASSGAAQKLCHVFRLSRQ